MKLGHAPQQGGQISRFERGAPPQPGRLVKLIRDRLEQPDVVSSRVAKPYQKVQRLTYYGVSRAGRPVHEGAFVDRIRLTEIRDAEEVI